MAGRAFNQNRDEGPGPRFNEVLLLKIGVTVTAALGLVLLASIFFIPTEIKILGDGKEQSEVRKELLARLEELGATWEPKQHQRLLDRAPENAARFAGPLDRMLRMRDSKLLEPAVEYAGALGVDKLRPTLASMTVSGMTLPPGVRSKAMKAAERLGPWTKDQLAEFLTQGTPPMKLAALEICAHRRDAPWPEILALFDGSDDTVTSQTLTAAAIKTVPQIPPPELLKALLEMVAEGGPDTASLALKALSRAKLEDEIYVKLARQLEEMESGTRMSCLDLLGAIGRRLPDPAPVWTLITSPETKPLVRARALYCLEQTRSIDAAEVRKQIFYMDPTAKYFAARCLLAADQKDGGEILLDLVDLEDDANLSVASRRLLAWLTGRSPGTSRKDFQLALGTMNNRIAGHLPEPGYVFGNQAAAPASGR